MANLVMYLRLSVEDDVNADESNSITNQRRIIREYISSHDDLCMMQAIEKCDDGYPGTNMNRPGMQELLELVKNQNVSCIIVKEFVGGIADIDIQFKSLLYDFYSKDLSAKVITAVNARKDNGMFVGVCAPFGYHNLSES